ncbi:glycosyl hydrolase [Sunxiuqinia indica]|uniref:glycosyl hydrolase n=1 Tax=Sunxiuqinia indica TaxID=2692584 RepID=UPI0013591097|nr:glycosyl hydrolase [Sunxiuqinia indica]
MTVELMNRLKRLTITIVFLITCFSQVVSQENEDKFSEFVGANTFLGEYNKQYLADLSSCVKWVREYHAWSHYEKQNDRYSWADTTSRKDDVWARHYEFLETCRELGVQVLLDVLNRPDWVNDEHIPNNTGDGSKSSDYIERIEFVSQLVARYGSTKIDTALLETEDKTSGTGYVKYFEDDNEPNYWWKIPAWSAADYAQYCIGVHAGSGLQTTNEYPLLGIKSVDPNAMHVMAGLAKIDTLYISEVMKACNGQIPFDILNVHMYCSDHKDYSFSPENEEHGFETYFFEYLKWKNRVLPDMPVWLTEFGWDTYKNEDGQHSYAYATPESQANYLLRSFLILKHLGFEKAFMYMAGDTDSKEILQYATCGLFMDKKNKLKKKLSYYYLATLQRILGDLVYDKALTYRQKHGENEVFNLKFTDRSSKKNVLVLWTRKIESDHDSGVKTEYQIEVTKDVNNAYLIKPNYLDMDGDTTLVKPQGGNLGVVLTETPQFLVIENDNLF